jgi:hypothetical protein
MFLIRTKAVQVGVRCEYSFKSTYTHSKQGFTLIHYDALIFKVLNSVRCASLGVGGEIVWE